MATSIDQKNFVKTALRLPPELHAAVHASAQKAGRSYNAELVFLLEKALTVPTAFIAAPSAMGTVDETGVLTSREPKELMAALAEKLGEAYNMARIFTEFESNEGARSNLSGAEVWLASRESEWPQLPTVKRVLPRSRKTKR